MKRTSLVTVAAVALALGFGAAAARAGGEKCATAHTQADYQRMAEKMAAKGWLGIETEKDAQGRYAVASIAPDSPAARAGFQVGDVLVALDGIALGDEKSKEKLHAAKKALGPGKSVRYTVARAGAERTLTATLAPVPREVLAQWMGEHVLDHTTVQVASTN